MPAENFPFCTIEPNQARVNVPDDRFNWLCGVYKPKSQVPAFLEVCDIAGLVRCVRCQCIAATRSRAPPLASAPSLDCCNAPLPSCPSRLLSPPS